MSDLGRVLIFAGLVLVAVGVALVVFSRLGLPLGRPPGDMTWKGSNWTVAFPLMSSIVLSVVLSLVLWIINHLRR